MEQRHGVCREKKRLNAREIKFLRSMCVASKKDGIDKEEIKR